MHSHTAPSRVELRAGLLARTRNLPRRALVLLALLVVVVACAVLWQLTGTGALATAAIRRWLWHMPRAAPTVALVMVGYALLTALGLPITAAIGIVALAFGTRLGLWISCAGSAGSAAAGYALGRWLGAGVLERLVPRRARALRMRLEESGALSTMILRAVPVAPFALVSLVAGACRLRVRDYALGTIAGVIPYVLAVTVLTHRILDAWRRPGSGTLLALLAAGVLSIAVLGAVVMWAKRHLRRRDAATR